MGEIYREELSKLGPVYQAEAKALDSALNKSTDPDKFTSEEIESNLDELDHIAKSKGMASYYLELLFERIESKKKRPNISAGEVVDWPQDDDTDNSGSGSDREPRRPISPRGNLGAQAELPGAAEAMASDLVGRVHEVKEQQGEK